ncbi:40S ribosomal protein S7 [Heterostelium album PN500]|uniref:40S ribosomal protein S7 n=1 Tax=Heterostelium pallidum (strain ATCC 26659 / Pp 5 / PN500) TaxID=670386 RepID=D3B963_HETP5|nr:40S ribosomal protein S7 [Heterostelium album PN500]EFA82102.1 40S ribosomal protein S7 [Heterostelium album PN500]|eukprot:XP_020434219.1 40S ribosomal protein S7 [Heterostelium album PN500]
MLTTKKKIVKPAGKEPTETENTIAQALLDLEQNDFKDLKDLQIVSAKEYDVSEGKKAIVIFVPFRQLKAYHKIQQKLVWELEKKLGGKTVMFIAQRRIIHKVSSTNKVKQQKVPISRTIKAVHDAMLDDLVFPTNIVGRRLRYRLDGTKLHKVYLDRKEMTVTEHKLDSFSAVYHKLTGKDVVFEFPVQSASSEQN